MSVTVAGIAVGIGGAYMQYESTQDAIASQEAGASASLDLQQQGLDLQREQWQAQMDQVAELESIFGPIRENLNNYYKNMNVEQFQLRNKAEIEKQYERSNQNIEAMFSNNGMYSSGQRASAQVALEAAREESLGTNLQQSEQQYNQNQMNWLGMGLQEKSAAQGLASQYNQNMLNSYNNMANTNMQSAGNMANLNLQQGQFFGNIGSMGMNVAGYAAGGGFGNQTTLQPGNTFTPQAIPGTTGGYDTSSLNQPITW